MKRAMILSLILAGCAKAEPPPPPQIVAVTAAPTLPSLPSCTDIELDPATPAKPKPDRKDGSLSEPGTVRHIHVRDQVIKELKNNRTTCAASYNEAKASGVQK